MCWRFVTRRYGECGKGNVTYALLRVTVPHVVCSLSHGEYGKGNTTTAPKRNKLWVHFQGENWRFVTHRYGEYGKGNVTNAPKRKFQDDN